MIQVPSGALAAHSPDGVNLLWSGAALSPDRFASSSARGGAGPTLPVASVRSGPTGSRDSAETVSGASARAKRARFDWPELDALRFFAFALVFCDHLPIDQPWFRPLREIGGFGVALFFCLSGYLIVTLLLLEREHTGTINLRLFAMRRALRVLPLYALVLAIGGAMGLVWPEVRINSGYLAALLLFYANMFCEHDLWMGVGCLAPLWSISVEAQFYVAIAFASRLRRRAMALLCVLVTAAAYVLLLHFGRARYSPVLQVWPNTLVQFQFLAAGTVIAAVLLNRKLRVALWLRTALGGAGVVLLYIAAMTGRIHSMLAVPTRNLLFGYVCELTGVAAIFLAVLHAGVRFPRWLTYLGRISYGLYGFHSLLLWLVFSKPGGLSVAAGRHPMAAAAGVLCATTVLAAASYELFERPILRRKQRFEVEKTRI